MINVHIYQCTYINKQKHAHVHNARARELLGKILTDTLVNINNSQNHQNRYT